MLINAIQRFFYKPLNVLNDFILLNFIDSSTSYFKQNNIDIKNKYELNYKCSDENNCVFNNYDETSNIYVNLIIDIIKKNSSFFVCKSLGGILVDNVYYKNTNVSIDKKYIFLMVIDTELFMKYINEFNYENIKIISKYFSKYNFILYLYKNICIFSTSIIFNLYTFIINFTDEYIK
jgi:hypothetical protein